MKRTRTIRNVTVTIIAAVALLAAGTGCTSTKNGIEAAMRALGASPGTIYNYGADGQIVFQAHCRSIDFRRDTEFDRYNAKGDKIEDSSVIKVSCGSGIISTVGFTTVYISDDARGSLFADSQQFARLRIDNNNRSIPLVNFAWRAVKDKFVGTSRVAQVCDQNNNPILAFSGDMVGYATDVNKSTLLQVTYNKHTGYVWIYHGSYTLTDTAVLG